MNRRQFIKAGSLFVPALFYTPKRALASPMFYGHQGAASVSTLKTGLTSYWKLEEASGTRSDAMGGNTLTSNDSVGQSTGKIGNCAHFASISNQWLSHVDNASLGTGDIDYTFAGWVLMDSISGFNVIISKWNTAGTKEYQLAVNSVSTKFEWSVSGDGTASDTILSSTVPTTATWYFLAVYHDSVNNLIGISVNNGTFATVAHATGSFHASVAFGFGSNATTGNNSFDGRMDEMGFWKRMLTATELSALYNSGSGLAFASF
jgi:hypothetical protein